MAVANSGALTLGAWGEEILAQPPEIPAESGIWGDRHASGSQRLFL
jgi:hypothetical protein